MSKDARRVIQEKRAAKRKKFIRQRLLLIAALAVLLISLVFVLADNLGKLSEQKNTPMNTETDVTLNETPTDDTLASSGLETTPQETVDNTVYEVTLVAVGDVLSHSPLLTMAKQADGTYDFTNYFSVMEDTFQAADIAIANQETIFGDPTNGYTTYPCFNTPETLGDALVNAGFDVITHATNHTRDAGVDGIEYCLAYWQTNHPQTTVLGIHDSQEASDTITVYEKNGITFAMLNYTYGLNGFTIPSEKSYLVDLMTEDTKEEVLADIKKAEELADFTIVFPHWGTENLVGAYTDEQRTWAEAFTDAGADLIIGTHPHVLEPVEWIETAAGNKSLCYYSLGNYISNQQDKANNIGGMAKVVIRKQGNVTEIVADESGCVPLINHNDKTGSKSLIRVYPINDYTQELLDKHCVYRKSTSFSMDYIKSVAEDSLGDFLIWDCEL
ncbi:MAG: CapA family protein [Lachnospiraceae bacterium]|nr:CapA family protein [Lachnospiraceae bacterium]